MFPTLHRMDCGPPSLLWLSKVVQRSPRCNTQLGIVTRAQPNATSNANLTSMITLWTTLNFREHVGMEVIAQKIFKSELDIMKLNIIDWNCLNGSWRNPADAVRTISSWFLGRAVYTIAREDLAEFPERDDWPGWKHVGRHERLGRLYWNAFYGSDMGTITFADEPDFSGTLIFPGYKRHFWGDIGKVSAQCFAM